MKIPNGFRVFCLFGFALLSALQLSIAGAQEDVQSEKEDIALEADAILGEETADADEKMSLLVDKSTMADLDFLKTGEAPTSVDQLKAMQQHVASLYDRVKPAVVNIQSGSGQGSGVVVTSDGYILTAAHVISTPNRGALITFPDGSRARAQTLGLHRKLDAGILRIYEVIPGDEDESNEGADADNDESDEDVEPSESSDEKKSESPEKKESDSEDSGSDEEMKQDSDRQNDLDEESDQEPQGEKSQEDEDDAAAEDSSDNNEPEKADESQDETESRGDQEQEEENTDDTDQPENEADDSEESRSEPESESAEEEKDSWEDLLEARRKARGNRFKVQDDLPSFPYLEIGNSADLNLGQWIIAVGHPGGLDLDRGLVLRVGRINQLDPDTIVTDCTLVGGDSGGPLIGMDGSVIGIHSRIGGRLRENYHVPSNEYINQWEELNQPMILDGTPDLGFTVRGSSCVIQKLSRQSLAARSGLKENDRVIRIGDKQIYDKIQMDDAVSNLKPYQVVEFEVQRKGKNVVLDVTIGESQSATWSRR